MGPIMSSNTSSDNARNTSNGPASTFGGSVTTQADSNNNKPDNNDSFRAPTPLSSEEPQDSNIQFVEVQTLLFGENPAPLNPKTIQLKNHEPTKASQKKCGIIKSYAANTN